jgi:hypothetical protein
VVLLIAIRHYFVKLGGTFIGFFFLQKIVRFFNIGDDLTVSFYLGQTNDSSIWKSKSIPNCIFCHLQTDQSAWIENKKIVIVENIQTEASYKIC